MIPWRPRAIIIGGPIGFFFVLFVPFAVVSPWPHGLVTALGWATVGTTVIGLPLFAAMAWVAIGEPKDDLNALGKHYRAVERYLAVVGMHALGFLAGCWLTSSALQESAHQTVLRTITIAFVFLSFIVVGSVALAKIAIVHRLRALRAVLQHRDPTIQSTMEDRARRDGGLGHVGSERER